MKNTSKAQAIFIFSMFFSVVCIFYFSFLDSGVQGLNQVKQEGSLSPQDEVSQKVAQVDVKNIKNYWISSDSLIAHGKVVYGNNCAVCHGPGGKGDGPASQGLNVRSLIEGKWKQGGSSIELFETLAKGVAGTSMVSFKHLPVLDRWALVHFIRSITKNKIKDDTKALNNFGSQSK